jgi:trans-aconitate methyltransferase
MQANGVQEAYSSLADQYIDLFGSGQREHPDDLQLIDRHLGHLPGPVLDLGCGPGHLTGYLRSRCPDVTGIDLVPEFIAHARQAHPTALRSRLDHQLDMGERLGGWRVGLVFAHPLRSR